MKISGSAGPQAAAIAPVSEAAASDTAKAATPQANTTGELQSAVLQPALQALRDMPDIDQAKVAALREALARGEVPFDAGKLAGLIARFHGGRG